MLYDAAVTEFVNPDGDPDHDGIKSTAATPDGESAYFGIMGSTPIDFRVGEKIIATFFNPTDVILTRIELSDETDTVAPTVPAWRSNALIDP